MSKILIFISLSLFILIGCVPTPLLKKMDLETNEYSKNNLHPDCYRLFTSAEYGGYQHYLIGGHNVFVKGTGQANGQIYNWCAWSKRNDVADLFGNFEWSELEALALKKCQEHAKIKFKIQSPLCEVYARDNELVINKGSFNELE